MTEQPNDLCAICGIQLTTPCYSSFILYKSIILQKKKNITTFVAKSKTRGELDWVAWENQEELTVHEGCRQKFAKLKTSSKHVDPTMNSYTITQEAACDLDLNYSSTNTVNESITKNDENIFTV